MNVKHWLIALSILGALLAACSPAATRAAQSGAAATSAPFPTRAAEATLAPFPTAAALGDSSAPAGDPQLAYAPAGSGLVIKDAEMELLVRDTDVAIAQVTQMAADYGGYILSSQTWYVDGFKYATLRLGIPSAQFEKALNYLRGLGLQVVRENASGQDVSAEYVDLQSKLANLEATAARVREFLSDAKTVEESLRINQQLAELEAQIEQVKGQMNYYQGRAAFSTVTVALTPQYPTPTPTLTPTATLTPTPTATFTPTPSWNPGATFDQASGVLVDVTQTVVDGLIWLFVVAGPVALVIALLAGAARWVFRRRGA